MDILVKCSALAVFGGVCSLLIRRSNPELAFALNAAVIAVILIASLRLSSALSDIIGEVKNLGVNSAMLRPILKCIGISIITRVSADLCRQSSSAASAYSIELTGAVCALAVSAPIISNVLKLIGELV